MTNSSIVVLMVIGKIRNSLKLTSGE